MSTLLSKFVCCTLILTVLCSGYGTVLCYGHDGHVTIEPVIHSHCHHEDHEHEEQNQEPAFSYSCHPCEDVPISNDFQPVRVKNSIQCSELTSNVCFSAATASSDAVRITSFEISTFFKPLNNIRLLT